MIWNTQDNQIILATPTGFSFNQNLSHLHRSKNECMFRVHDNKVRKAIATVECIALVEIRERDEHSLTIEFLGNTKPTTKQAVERVMDYIIEWFDSKNRYSSFL